MFSVFVTGIIVGKVRGIPFIRDTFGWAIGIYEGDDQFNFTPKRGVKVPTFTADKVKDIPAEFVADPFLVEKNGLWYLFFEAMNMKTFQGDIGVAISKDLNEWIYQKIVLDEPFHLSYPYVFQWEGEYYMIPEVYQTNSVKLYKAKDFPNHWEYVDTLIYGDQFVDPSVFYYKNRWWMFVATTKNDTLYLYSSELLTGPWVEHPQSPVVKNNKRIARPGGRVIVDGESVIRLTQNDEYHYGNELKAFEITELTETTYQEKPWREESLLKSNGKGWNKNGMHHLDAHRIGANQWVAAVDGHRNRFLFSLKY